ncbi:PspC domain-containing protein [Alistipes sp.]|uniref:PspC domain-containing protein n=1 Tax=Alistipes sp. TaxID=1872444 RepID=UPI003A88528F
MKEVKKCSISGIAFTLDADAYTLLSDYLDSLKATYAATTDGEEIVADIEARIAELILTQQESSRVVEAPLLQRIIAQMGTAETIRSESDAESGPKQPRIPRRLYRDTENARLGGVCAGLGRYFDTDATWVRLTLFAPLLLVILVAVLPFGNALSGFFANLFGVFALGYFVMWFAVPAARTARQRLEMEGEPITVRSIRERTAAGGEANGEVKSLVARVIYAFGQLTLVVIKILTGFIIFGLTLAACALLLILLAFLFGDATSHGVVDIAAWSNTSRTLVIAALLTMLIPLLLLIYVLFCLIASRKPSRRAALVVFLFWIATLVSTGWLALEEFGSWNRDGLHGLFAEPRSEVRDELRDWVASDTVAVIATEPAQPTPPADPAERSDDRPTPSAVDTDFDDASYE